MIGRKLALPKVLIQFKFSLFSKANPLPRDSRLNFFFKLIYSPFRYTSKSTIIMIEIKLESVKKYLDTVREVALDTAYEGVVVGAIGG